MEERYARGKALARVRGLVTGLPFNVAAGAGLLIGIDRFASEDGIDSCAEIFASDRFPVVGAAVIELAPIDELAMLVEDEKVRSARGTVSLGNLLTFVVQEGEVEAELERHFF